MNREHSLVKYACYTANLSMSIVAMLSPLLFLTFRRLYGISFSMLGSLILINFCTQLTVDLVFSFCSHRLNLVKAVKITPALTALGLLVYAASPWIFPNAVYAGLALGTAIFSASGGLAEVLISPVIAQLPAENPEREMSKLHSVYAWGVVGVVVISTVFLLLLGADRWQWLVLLWVALPLLSCRLFARSRIPALRTPERASHVWRLLKDKGFLLCLLCIFFGGASECAMSQWSSSYLEQSFQIPKVWGDVLGVALFAVMLGLGRTLFSQYGKNIHRVLVISAAGATLCYAVAAVSNLAPVGLIACAMTGLCTAMLWPGSLMIAADRFPSSGVAVFALMAAGGDLGGAVAPQLVGTVVDLALRNDGILALATALNLSADQLGMKIGLASAIVFPLLAMIMLIVLARRAKRQRP